MQAIFLIGSKNKENPQDLDVPFRHEKGILLSIDLDTLLVKKEFEYISPTKYMASPDASITFKSGHLDSINSILYLCTTTEVLIYNISQKRIVNHISHPLFNDVHHVTPYTENTILVASTGIDAILEVDLNSSEVLNIFPTVEKSSFRPINSDIDYRKIISTKPHRSHPNFIQRVNDEIWITRFEQRDSCELQTLKQRIPINIEKPHDGCFYENKVYYTTVDGHIIIANADTYEIIRIVSLKKFEPTITILGWCRSLKVLNSHELIVGFSRIRPTRNGNNLSFLSLKKSLKNIRSLPCRIIKINLRTMKKDWQVDLEENEMNTIFSIL